MAVDKANEYGVEALKQIITLAGAILALTITFLKDALGDAREHAKLLWLVPVGWLCLIISILLAWYALAEVANSLGTQGTGNQIFAFAKKPRDPRGRIRAMLTPLGWLFFFIPTNEENITRKLAASAQQYFFLGLVLLGLFTFINLRTPPSKPPPTQAPPSTPAVAHVSPTAQSTPLTRKPKRRRTPCNLAVSRRQNNLLK